MALTEEQIKNLTPGDPLVIHTTFDKIDEDGDLWFQCPQMFDEDSIEYIHPKCVSLPDETVETPKYDPCRLFKKGDIVEMDTHGRDIAASMKKAGVELGKRYTVTEDENNTGYVSFIGDDGIEHHSKFFWLKLVTPVEELELFYLDEITDEDEDEEQYHCFMIKTLKGEDKIRTYYSNKFETIAQTKAAAEAECKRLNEEYRKEHE